MGAYEYLEKLATENWSPHDKNIWGLPEAKPFKAKAKAKAKAKKVEQKAESLFNRTKNFIGRHKKVLGGESAALGALGLGTALYLNHKNSQDKNRYA